MAFVFDATISGISSNSYAPVANADDYFGGTNSDGTWSALTDTFKQQYLTMATTRLESELFGGYPVTTTQSLQFPRSNITSRYAEDYKSSTGAYPSSQYYAEDAIPKEIEQATFELALYFLNKNNDNLGTMDELDLEQLQSLEIGPLKTSAKDNNFMVEQLPSKVKRMLSACGPDTWTGNITSRSIRG